MKNDNNKNSAFIYIGNDRTHWQALILDFKQNYPNLSFEPQILSGQTAVEIQSLFVKIYHIKPKAVFIDFTHNFHEHLHLARLLSRTNTDFHFFLGGLIEGQGQQMALKRSLLTGISSLFVKSSENDGLIYSCMCIAFPSLVQAHGFATANVNESTPLYIPARASIISQNSIQIESNEKLSQEQSIRLHSYWSEKKILQSLDCKLLEQKEDNLFYPYRYAQKLQFKLDEFPDSKERMKEWIAEHVTESHPKLTKALIIDRSFHFFQDQERTDNYPFVLRCQPFLKNPKEELLKNKADLIVYQFDDVTEVDEEASEETNEKVENKVKKEKEEVQEFKNDLEGLWNLIKAIQLIDDYNPFVIVFNTKTVSAETIKKKMGFEQILVHTASLNPELILKMAEVLNKKLAQKLNAQKEALVFLDKKSDQTYVEIEREITILKISENDIYFNYDQKIIPYAPMRITYPVELLLTVVEKPKHINENGGHYAIINGLGESERMEIRKFINSVFFRQKNDAKRKEKEAFDELNKKVLEERAKKAEQEEN